MPAEYKVKRILWESLESVLLAQSKKYIAELANYLNVPEKELIKEVLPSSDSLKVYIQDSDLSENKCKAFVQNNYITEYCRKPVAYGSEFCCNHVHKRMGIVTDTNTTEYVERIKDRYDLNKAWINDKNIVDSNGNIIGKINKENNSMKLFVLKST
jgi:hypothetical protein